jgi:hypothetical protein
MLCLLGGYILIGAIYRYYFLGIHSIEVMPVLHKVLGLNFYAINNPTSISCCFGLGPDVLVLFKLSAL